MHPEGLDLRKTLAAGALAGLLADLVGLFAFTAAGLPFGAAHLLAGAVSLIWTYRLNARHVRLPAREPRWLRSVGVGVLGLLLRGSILAAGGGSAPALVLAALALAGFNLAANLFYVFGYAGWRVTAIAMVGCSVLLRLVYVGLPDLLPEEAYYYAYARHLSLSYFDHPPMVGWLISIGRSVLGDTELGVRIAALLCWGVAAWFVHRLACEMFGKGIGLMTLVLFAVLPYFLAMGLFMFPDAPLVACWAAAALFLWRALVGGQRHAWWGVGLALGLGMLSKYTISLLVPATALFMVLDPRARRWWRRPEPYLAGLLALLVFSPVIVWNAQHDWASFRFQGVERHAGPWRFGLHNLVFAVVVMLTPLGAWAVVRSLAWRAPEPTLPARGRRRLFVAVLTLVPLAVFALFSLKTTPKMIWTGPIWLTALPLIAASIARAGRRSLAVAIGWEISLFTTVIVAGVLLHFLVLGWPGVPYRARNRMPVGWREMSREVATIEDRLARETGARPFVVGMDRYFIAAEMAFYGAGREREVTGINLFGENSLMFGSWAVPREMDSRPAVLVAFEASRLDSSVVAASFAGLGPVQEHVARRNGQVATRFFTRVAR